MIDSTDFQLIFSEIRAGVSLDAQLRLFALENQLPTKK